MDKSVGDGFRTFSQLFKGGRNQSWEKNKSGHPLIHVNFGGIGCFNIFGVLDGHEENGHFVSQFCGSYFIKKFAELSGYIKKRILMTTEALYNELN